MSAHHDHAHDLNPSHMPAHEQQRYRRVLWFALISNAAMFLVEVTASYRSGSLALLADAIDFGGDAANYAISMAVLSAALRWRARTAMLKAVTMMAFGAFVLARAISSLWQGHAPDPTTMGAVAALALAVNLAVAWALYAFRTGDANMRSVWLCSRNDAISNLAVMVAALGVFGTQSAWPDLLVAAIMASLALSSGWQVAMHARRELSMPEHHVHDEGH
ncbi:MAG: cation transporter [Burkholderiaceae bacterium]